MTLAFCRLWLFSVSAARKSPSRENINNSLLRSSNYAESSVASPSVASQAWPTGQSSDASHAWPSAQSSDARQAWPTAVQSSDARQAWPTAIQPSDANQVWPNNGTFRSVRSVRQSQQKEQLFTMRQMEAICKIIVNEQMEKVVDEFNNILASEAASMLSIYSVIKNHAASVDRLHAASVDRLYTTFSIFREGTIVAYLKLHVKFKQRCQSNLLDVWVGTVGRDSINWYAGGGK